MCRCRRSGHSITSSWVPTCPAWWNRTYSLGWVCPTWVHEHPSCSWRVHFQFSVSQWWATPGTCVVLLVVGSTSWVIGLVVSFLFRLFPCDRWGYSIGSVVFVGRLIVLWVIHWVPGCIVLPLLISYWPYRFPTCSCPSPPRWPSSPTSTWWWFVLVFRFPFWFYQPTPVAATWHSCLRKPGVEPTLRSVVYLHTHWFWVWWYRVVQVGLIFLIVVHLNRRCSWSWIVWVVVVRSGTFYPVATAWVVGGTWPHRLWVCIVMWLIGCWVLLFWWVVWLWLFP